MNTFSSECRHRYVALNVAASVAFALLLGTCMAAEDATPDRVRIGELRVPTDSPLLTGEYPRLVVTQAQLPAIRARLKNPEIQMYIGQAEELVRLGKASPLLLATLYQMTGQQRYAAAAKRTLGNPTWLPEWTLAFDLVAATQTESERKDMARKILEAIEANRWRPRLLNCLAAWGNGLDDKLLPYLESSYREEIVGKLDYCNTWSQGRGGSSMGHGYNGEHFFSAEFAAMIAWSHAAGDDVISRCDFAHNTPAWYVYHYLPWKTAHQVLRIGVTMSPSHVQALTPQKHDGESWVMLDITRTRNGLGQWWEREFIGNWPMPNWRRGEEHTYGLAGRLLWLDPSIPSIPPKRFPETRLFPENGHVVMRSNWTDDATIALFRCGRFGEIDGYGGRNNLDNLHFIIYRNGYLAPDTGCVHSVNEKVWKMQPPSNVHHYGKQTVAHNTITVGRERYAVHGYRNRLLAASERGGQVAVQKPAWYQAWGLETPTATNMPASFKEGQITAYSTSPVYDYACGDATHSYPPERVKKITRQFLYLKPDLFVIFDRVIPADPALEVIWNLHAYARPAWNGKTTPLPQPEGHFLHTAGDTFTTTNRGGAFMETRLLLPIESERRVRSIGGNGHDFEVNGTNYGPTEETYHLLEQRKGDGGLEGVGGWRIEVAPKAVSGEVRFLHVLRVGSSPADKQTPLATTLVTDAQRVGVKIRLGAKEAEVQFSTVGEPGGRLVLGGHGEDLVTRIEDNYDRWKSDPRYQEWMNNEFMRTVIFPYGPASGRSPHK